MNKKVYFSGSIRGGRGDAMLYHRIIEMIKQTDTVLTEHVGNINYSTDNRTPKSNQDIYNQDTAWLKECDLVIAECSQVSLGVGYEMAYAEKLNKPVYIFYRHGLYLSAMLSGNSYFICQSYRNEDELFEMIKKVLKD